MQAPTLDTLQLLAPAAALGWACGPRAFLVMFAVGLAGLSGWVQLVGFLSSTGVLRRLALPPHTTSGAVGGKGSKGAELLRIAARQEEGASA